MARFAADLLLSTLQGIGMVFLDKLDLLAATLLHMLLHSILKGYHLQNILVSV